MLKFLRGAEVGIMVSREKIELLQHHRVSSVSTYHVFDRFSEKEPLESEKNVSR